MIDRDTIINTLLGAFLLIVLCLYIAAIGSLFLLALIALQWLMHRFFLPTSLPFLAILAIWAAMATWYSIQHAREGRWKNVFLQLVSIPLLGFAWFAHTSPAVEAFGAYREIGLYWFPIFMIFSASGIVTLGRFYFFLASAVAAGSVAVNSGMLGNGVVAHTVANCVLGGITVWFIDIVRKNWGTKVPDQPIPLPLTKA